MSVHMVSKTLARKDVWITREGERVEIKKMASRHLLSTIHFIERNRFDNAVECAARESENPDVEDLSQSAPLQYYLQWPEQYEEMIKEAVRRKLIER